MEILGLLKVRVYKGTNLAVRDALSSDPYCVITCEKQRVRTRVVKRNCNPVWNDELTIYMKDPNDPLVLSVYDKDTFTDDDGMGHANIDIIPMMECLNMDLENLQDGDKLDRIQPTVENCLADESCVEWNNGKLTQDMCLRLKNVESGQVEIQIEWVEIPGAKRVQVTAVDRSTETEKMKPKKAAQVISIVKTMRRRLSKKTLSGAKTVRKHLPKPKPKS